MQSEEQPAFRPNPKVAMMILVTMMALFVPILCLVWLGRDYFRPKPAVPAEALGLRETIERTADEALPIEGIAGDRPLLIVPTGQTADTLRSVADSLGASVVELEEGRYLVSGREGIAAAFAKALNVEPPRGEDEGLFEVRVGSPN